MLGKLGSLSEINHPTRRRFLSMAGASLVPKLPIDLLQIQDNGISKEFSVVINRERLDQLEEHISGKDFPYDFLNNGILTLKSIIPDLNIPEGELGIGIILEKVYCQLAEIEFQKMKGLLKKIPNSILDNSDLEVQVNVFDMIAGSGDGFLGLDELHGSFEVLGDINKGGVFYETQLFLSNDGYSLSIQSDEYCLNIDGNIDDIENVRDFLNLTDEEFLSKMNKKNVIRRKNINESSYLNTTALTPIAHIKNRVFYLHEETPEYFPLSFAMQDVLGKTELDVEVLLREFQNA